LKKRRKTDMEEIIRILMERDGVSYDEAKEMYEDTKSELMDALDGTSDVSPDEVLQYELGLEIDYLFNFI
jgi:hypothetical protein